MEQQIAILQQQLRAQQQYNRKLQITFNYNVQVIEQREQQIEELSQRLAQLQNNNQTLEETFTKMQEQHQFEARLMTNQYELKAEAQQKETQEVVSMMEARMRKELQAVTQRMGQQTKLARVQLMERDESSRRMLQQNSRLNEIILDLKGQLLQFQTQVTSLNEEKNAISSKMALHQQQLQGIRSCNSSWEDMLKEKLKEAQKEKQALVEEFGDYKVTVKQKLKKQKEDLARKINQLTEDKENQARLIAHEQKELRYKLEKALGEQRQNAKQLEMLKAERDKLQTLLSKYKEHELKSNFQKNQKQYQCLLKIFEQDKRDLKAQIQAAHQERKQLKDQLDEVITQRQEKEKAIQRLRVDSINKAKENDEMKKQIKRLKHEFQAKIKDYENAAQMLPPMANISKKMDRNYDSKGFDFVQSVKIQNDYSKVFTEDVGPIDEDYFLNNAAKSPKHYNASAQRPNRQAQLMKQVSQLQLQLQQYKTIIKKLKDEMENIRKVTEQQRNREISLHRDRANVYWEKANDKEQQLNHLKEINNQLKTSNYELMQELKSYKENETLWRSKDQELQQMKEKIVLASNQITELEEEIDMVTKDRDLMQQISSDLRAENHSLKQILSGNSDPYHQENQLSKSQNEYSKSQQQFRHQMDQQPKIEETVPFYMPQRQRFPKKLHDLVREKKMLSVSGKKAAMQERATQTRLQHIHAGTDSQKEVLQRIKVKNKTPPKIANYAEMKKDKERRSHQLQTISQKQVFQRLKSRQNSQNLSPQLRGINYLQLRDMGAE